ncbi:hypothetical protein AB0K05_03205 [Nonomuraea sp. NPDC049486]|uniref:hypothetical protein n=1 Tax=Nonomuraea sp. NPDC049486 TaxID=3155773 RepID=UPI00342FFCA0
MIDSLFDRASSILEKRFLRNAFLPVLLFPPVTLLPSLLQGGRLEALVAAWSAQSLGLQVIETLGFFALSWFGASVLASQWRNIVRLFEGYPWQRWHRIYGVGRKWHGARQAELQYMSLYGPNIDAAVHLQHRIYPEDPSHVLATRLGNVLRAAEAYPIQRYGAGLVTLWPRLYHVLPREIQNDVENARATMEFLLVLSLWFCGFGVMNPFIAWFLDTSMPLALGLLGVSLFFAYCAYVSAIPAAIEYGQYLKSAFEVYRFALLKRLRLRQPTSMADEKKQWADLQRLILENLFLDSDYEPDTEEIRLLVAGPDTPTKPGGGAR